MPEISSSSASVSPQASFPPEPQVSRAQTAVPQPSAPTSSARTEAAANVVEQAPGDLARPITCGERSLTGNGLRAGLAKMVGDVPPNGGVGEAKFAFQTGEGIGVRLEVSTRIEKRDDGKVVVELSAGEGVGAIGVAGGGHSGHAGSKDGLPHASAEAKASAFVMVAARDVLVYPDAESAVHGVAAHLQQLGQSQLVGGSLLHRIGVTDESSACLEKLGEREQIGLQVGDRGAADAQACLGKLGVRLGVETTGAVGIAFDQKNMAIVLTAQLQESGEASRTGSVALPGHASLEAERGGEISRERELRVTFPIPPEAQRMGLLDALRTTLGKGPASTELSEKLEVRTPSALEVAERKTEVHGPKDVAAFLANDQSPNFELKSYHLVQNDARFGAMFGEAEMSMSVRKLVGSYEGVSPGDVLLRARQDSQDAHQDLSSLQAHVAASRLQAR